MPRDTRCAQVSRNSKAKAHLATIRSEVMQSMQTPAGARKNSMLVPYAGASIPAWLAVRV